MQDTQDLKYVTFHPCQAQEQRRYYPPCTRNAAARPRARPDYPEAVQMRKYSATRAQKPGVVIVVVVDIRTGA